MANIKDFKKKELLEKKEKRKKKILHIVEGIILFIVLLFIGLFALYQYLHIKEGFTIYFSNYNIQNEYARFLVEINDDFIKKMIMFDDVIVDKNSYEEYSEEEIEYLSNIILAENSILSRLNNTPPDDNLNFDYKDVYSNMTYAYALYIQGQLMQMEYIMQTTDGLNTERYVIGESVTNLMGNFIIEYAALSNKVRGTSYASRYSVMDGLPYNLGTAEEMVLERDENGNIIIDPDKIYLYLPDDEDIVEKESSKEELDGEDLVDVSEIQGDVENFLEDFLEIQNEE